MTTALDPVASHAASTDSFLAALDRGLARQQQVLPDWTPAAQEAADRFLAGGRLFVGGPAPDFVGEASGRSGGLGPLTALANAESPGPQDAAVMGFSGPDQGEVAVVRGLNEQGVLTIGFGSRAQRPEIAAACAWWIDAQAEESPAGAPIAGILDVASLWSFIGEFVAACTRQGAMPPIWQSAMIPESAARNRRYSGVRVHADLQVDPVPVTRIGQAYLSTLRSHLAGFVAGERDRLRQAGEEISLARACGCRAWFFMDGGHMRAAVLALPDGPQGLEILERPPDLAGLTASLQPGDLVYVQGYTVPPSALVTAAHAVGARVCASMAGSHGQPAPRTAADLVLDAQWQLGDAAVPVPGYDIPILPPSGFMAAAIYWALMLEAQAAR
ncbi:MAG: hypothetical protein WDA75_17620 [Candidatus Latescibacterota bacterium]|jgi:hypothetical protein